MTNVPRRDFVGLMAAAGAAGCCPCGGEPPERIEIHEGAIRFLVDVRHGHKTGFYLDQRAARAQVGAFAAGRDVLNCFSYTGGFGLACAAGGAKSVENLDLLYVGAIYLLPTSVNNVKTEEFTKVMAHTMKKGETAYEVFSSYGIDYYENLGKLKSYNHGNDLTKIAAGEKLLIPII